MPMLLVFIVILIATIFIFWGCHNRMNRKTKNHRRKITLHIDSNERTTVHHWQIFFVFLIGTIVFVEATEVKYNVWIVAFIALLLGGLLESVIHNSK